MKINTVVQFGTCDVDVTNTELVVKEFMKENKIKQKDVDHVDVYVKPEARYVVIHTADKEYEAVL